MKCLATYQKVTGSPLAKVNVDVQYDVSSVVNIGKDLLCADLIGEHVNISSETCNRHSSVCPFVGSADAINDPVDSFGVFEDMLAKNVVCEGVTVVNDEGFPILHSHGSDPEGCRNRKLTGRSQVMAPEGSGQPAEEKGFARILLCSY